MVVKTLKRGYNFRLEGREKATEKTPLKKGIAKIILNFIDDPPKIPRRRYIIARHQLLSLYRRMNFHPEKVDLCTLYENEIKKIIILEKRFATWLSGISFSSL
jgi:hypothetical protein